MSKITKIRLSSQTYTIEDSSALHNLDSIVTSDGSNAVASSGIYSAITAATNALAESIAEQGYQTSGDVQNAISGKLDTSIFETYSGNVDTALASKFAGATWNSNDKKIYFYDNASNTGTALAYIDGTDFVKDGFLSSVTIDNRTISGESVPCLVFIWNTDSGIQETDIPLSGIFDPTNYVDVATYTTYTAATETALSGKQDTLSAGTGIDITNDVISVTGVPMTIDTQMSDSSTNPVENKTIKSYVDTEVAKKNQVITVSGTTLVIS